MPIFEAMVVTVRSGFMYRSHSMGLEFRERVGLSGPSDLPLKVVAGRRQRGRNGPTVGRAVASRITEAHSAGRLRNGE